MTFNIYSTTGRQDNKPWQKNEPEKKDQWFNLKQFCDYHPRQPQATDRLRMDQPK